MLYLPLQSKDRNSLLGFLAKCCGEGSFKRVCDANCDFQDLKTLSRYCCTDWFKFEPKIRK